MVSAAFGTSFLLVALLRPEPRFLRLTLVVMGVEAVVGVIGFALHLHADLHHPGEPLRDRLIYGAPVFAPMLFADMALLAAIGVWGLLQE